MAAQGTFDKQIAAFTKKAQKEMDTHYRANLLQLFVNIVDGTPRDTGTLKNAWQFSQQLNSFQPPVMEYSAGEVSNTIAKAAAAAKMMGILDEVFIFNNMPYAQAIEDGLGKGHRVAHKMVAKAIALAKGKLIVRGS